VLDVAARCAHELCLPHPERRIPLFYPILEVIAGGSFQHVDSSNTRPSIDMCRNETAEPVPVVPTEPRETVNAQARLEAYLRSLNEYIALSDAVLDTESEEDDYLRFLEKLVPLCHKKQEIYTSRMRILLYRRRNVSVGAGGKGGSGEDSKVGRGSREGKEIRGNATGMGGLVPHVKADGRHHTHQATSRVLGHLRPCCHNLSIACRQSNDGTSLDAHSADERDYAQSSASSLPSSLGPLLLVQPLRSSCSKWHTRTAMRKCNLIQPTQRSRNNGRSLLSGFLYHTQSEWWRYLRASTLHLVFRDLHPTLYPFRDMGLRGSPKWLGRSILAWHISENLAVLLMDYTERTGPATYSFFQSATLFRAGISSQVIQACMLFRPLRHLTAWLADGIASLVSSLWFCLSLRIRGDKTQATTLV
jgi:hypothetical protein